MAGTLEQAVKDKAHALGFALAGITSPAPPAHFSKFEEWLLAGRHGQMAYLASERSRARRADPLQILPECRSILVLATPYSAPKSPQISRDRASANLSSSTGQRSVVPSSEAGALTLQGAKGALHGQVAAYAWGADYHDMLPARMLALVQYIEARVGHSIANRAYTDSGPILERDLAQRAGLGWIGKNTCLINPRAGSYFLLSEILLGIDLSPDAPLETDHCGGCRRCIDACPTECILPDRTLDARRCVSYLTIELKTDIPVELRHAVGNWVFGCDVCQMVCPWNRFASEGGDAAFAGPPSRRAPALVPDLALNSQDFVGRHRHSPVKRAKHAGYLRNVAVALGNRGDATAVPALERAVAAQDPLVARHAGWAIEQIKVRADA